MTDFLSLTPRRLCLAGPLAFAIALATGGTGVAELVSIEIREDKPFAGGTTFGRSGSYEIIGGRLFYEVDPDDPSLEGIADLGRAPTNEDSRVAFWSDFTLLKPTDPAKGNGCLLYDVHNRGNKLALWVFNEGERSNQPSGAEHAGNGFLMREGYSVLWTGWNGEVQEDGAARLLAGLPVASREDGSAITGRNHVEITVDEPVHSREFIWSPWGVSKAYPSASPDNSDAVLTMQPHRGAPAEEIARADWAFARWEDGEAIPDPASLYVKEGFRPGWIYDLIYTARDPRVSGLGLVGLRDAVAFFRFGEAAADGARNPLRGAIDRAVIFGVSQSGRLAHHFLYEGLNVDPAGRRVFDGALIHVAGAGKGLFNHRFGMATTYGTYREGTLWPTDFFPFAPMPVTDPVTGESGDSLARLRDNGGVPKIMFVQTSTEYWSRAASLLHTDVSGERDLEVDPDVRVYLIAGTQHLDGSDDPHEKGVSRYAPNPVKHRSPVLRALLTALDRWMGEENLEPPASRYPRTDDGTLVDLDTFRGQFPAIPKVTVPEAHYQPLRLDPGTRWEREGIADEIPPEAGAPFRTLVPAVDADGNERAGIRLPAIAAPLGTATGWNLRDDAFGAGGQITGLAGAWFPFPDDAAGREATGDPRPSIAERYPDRAAYLAAAVQSLLELREGGYLLDEDVSRLLEEAAAIDLPAWKGAP
ncbi:alpha/beta hydrolase domain-containing protein [soil metagenome]